MDRAPARIAGAGAPDRSVRPPSRRSDSPRRITRYPFPRRREIATVGLVTALAVMVAVALLGYRTTGALVETVRSVDHTHQVIEVIDEVLRNATSAGRARRTYALTGDEADLPRVMASIAASREAVAEVRSLVSDNPTQMARLDRMAPILAERFADIEAAIIAQQRTGVDAAREEAAARRSNETMVRVASIVDEIIGQERSLLAGRQARADRGAEFVKWVEIGGTAVSIAIIAVAFAGLRRENARRLRSEEATDRANRFLDSIVEHIPDMIFVKEAGELRFERLNRAGELLLGVSRSDLLGKNDHDLFSKEQADFFRDKDRETLEGAVILDIPEEPIDTKQGRRWLHTKKVPLLGVDGLPRYLLGISEDITERKKTAEALRVAIESAESANRELEAFSYSVAHDLRAPLRSIDGFGMALMEDCVDQLSQAGQQHLQRIRAAAKRMGQLIDGLLALSRVARTELRFETVDLSALASASVDELRQGAAGRDVQVHIEPSLKARGDPRLLRIVLDNLLGNAFKFTGTHPRAMIVFGARDDGPERVYSVRDDGVGFDRGYADKLFGAFQRLHDVRDFPGTGIGLATVHRVIARHGGRIWAHGDPERGATFSFTLGGEASGSGASS
jgi:PAS domain S-box-containing protein